MDTDGTIGQEDGLPLLQEVARRLWAARDTAEIGHDAVTFDGIVYEQTVTPEDAGGGVTRIRRDGHEHVTTRKGNPIDVVLQGVVSWRMLRLLEGPGVRLPESIQVDCEQEMVRAQGWRGLLGAKVPAGTRRTTVTDPVEIARHQLARLVIGRIENEGLRTTRGSTVVEIDRGVMLMLEPLAPTLTLPTGGSTRIVETRRDELLAAIATNNASDRDERP